MSEPQVEMQVEKIDRAIDRYFVYILEELTTSDQPRFKERVMDYFLMKPFLITALNHFASIDGSFEDENIKEAKTNMQKVAELWQVMVRKTTASLESLYEEVYLKKQVAYLVLYEENLEIVKNLEKQRANLDTINRQMESAKESLRRAKGEEKLKLLSLSKALNGRNVDIVHNIATEKERQTVLIEDMQKLYDAHIEEFKESFSKRVVEIKDELGKVLGLMAFRLDRAIWQRAKRSQAIKNFFYESGITGLFSSKTFLQYFVKNIDQNKASPAQKELVKYLENFNKTNLIKIAIIGQNLSDLDQLKVRLEKIDKIISCTTFTSIEVLLNKHQKEPFYAIISSVKLPQSQSIARLIGSFRERFPTEADQLFVANLSRDDFDKEQEIARGAGVSHHIDDAMSYDKLLQRIVEIL